MNVSIIHCLFNDFTAEPTNVNLNQTYVISTQDESTDTKDDEDAAPNTSVFAQDLGSFTQPENQEESNLESNHNQWVRNGNDVGPKR